jgi:hypothetical protein
MANRKRISEWDSLIKQGLMPREIAEITGLTRQAMELYIKNTGQTEESKKKRKKIKENRKKAEELEDNARWYVNRGIDLSLRDQLEGSELWGFNRAVQYYENRNGASMDFNLLKKFLTDYQSNRRSRKMVGLKSLGSPYGIAAPVAGKILEFLGYEPLGGNLHTEQLTQDQRDALDRSVDLDMPDRDISHFLGLLEYTAERYYDRFYTREKDNSPIASLARYGSVTYRISSQIYGREHNGLTNPGILRSLNIKAPVRDYALDHKREISSTIKEALKIIHNRKTVRSPWVHW